MTIKIRDNDGRTMEKFAKLVEQEMKLPERWWYLSFAQEGDFRGALVIKAHGIAHATTLAMEKGIKPGGEVIALPMPDESLPPEEWRGRLMSEAEVKALYPDAKYLGEVIAENGGIEHVGNKKLPERGN